MFKYFACLPFGENKCSTEVLSFASENMELEGEPAIRGRARYRQCSSDPAVSQRIGDAEKETEYHCFWKIPQATTWDLGKDEWECRLGPLPQHRPTLPNQCPRFTGTPATGADDSMDLPLSTTMMYNILLRDLPKISGPADTQKYGVISTRPNADGSHSVEVRITRAHPVSLNVE